MPSSQDVYIIKTNNIFQTIGIKKHISVKVTTITYQQHPVNIKLPVLVNVYIITSRIIKLKYNITFKFKYKMLHLKST